MNGDTLPITTRRRVRDMIYGSTWCAHDPHPGRFVRHHTESPLPEIIPFTDLTVDGGSDAIGRYRVGPLSDPVEMEFALEAKCYSPGVQGLSLTTVGVRETARLISRLRHRQFGILVTTAVVAKQAYAEIRQDRHPVVVLCGRDLAQILIGKGLNSAARVQTWLRAEFAPEGRHTVTDIHSRVLWEAIWTRQSYRSSCRFPREDAKALGHAIVEILNRGYYLTPASTRVDIRDLVADSAAGTASYPPEVDPPARSRQKRAMTVEVRNMTTLAGVSALQAQGFDPGALDFSATRHGGGFLSGALAQEEYLARSSALWACLRGNPMYAYHRPAQGSVLYRLRDLLAACSGDRDDDGVLLEAPYQCAIITSPAVHARGVQKYMSHRMGKIAGVMWKRILKVLAVAESHGHRSLVLGAWGAVRLATTATKSRAFSGWRWKRISAAPSTTFCLPSRTGRTKSGSSARSCAISAKDGFNFRPSHPKATCAQARPFRRASRPRRGGQSGAFSAMRSRASR